MANPYLDRLREKYQGIKESVEGLQTRAAEENRDLTETERTSVRNMSEEGKKLYTEIEELTLVEQRNAQVAQLDLQLQRNTQRTKADRGEGAPPASDKEEVYTRSAKYGFFSDHYRATRFGDKEAAGRLEQHAQLVAEAEQYRGITTSTGSGLVAPIWLADLFAPNIHKRLRIGSLVRRVPFAGPQAWTLGVAGTGAGTETQTTEGTNPTESNPTAAPLTVTPKAISGFTDVSRQLLDAGNPAADAILWGDMMGDFYDDAEAELVTALAGQASVNTATVADGAALPAARDAVLDMMGLVGDLSGEPDLWAGRTSRWTRKLKWADTTNRPLVVSARYGPTNAIGRGEGAQIAASPIVGELEGMPATTSSTIAANLEFVLDSQQVIFSVSEPEQFTYREVVGPAEVRVGVWGYATVITGRRPKAIGKLTYTAN